MKRMIAVVAIVAMVASVANAGWLSGWRKAKMQTLKPALGYVESVSTETNAWKECIENYEKGIDETFNRYLIMNDGCITFTSANESLVWNNVVAHECPDCNKKHVDDWPKTKTKVKGVQHKTTTQIYKDGKLISTLTEYAYPHQKITEKTTTKIRYEHEVKTVWEPTAKESK